MQGSQYTEEQRREAVIAYHILGSGEAVSKATGIPDSTISNWKQQEWWHHVSGEIRNDIKAELSARMLTTGRKCLDALEDRIENGDAVAFKDGTIVRAPIRARDAAVVYAIMFDKRQLLNNQPTSINEQRDVKGLATEMVAAFKAAQERVISGQVLERSIEE